MTRGLDTDHTLASLALQAISHAVACPVEYIVRLVSNLVGASQSKRFMDMPISTTCHVEDSHVDSAANYNCPAKGLLISHHYSSS
jgi:hypothetical protein